MQGSGVADQAAQPPAAATPGAAGPVHRFLLCGFVLDPIGRTLSRDGQRLPLTARLFDMLLYLVEHRDRVVERDELLAAVWAGRHVEEGTVARAISSVRAILRAHGAGDTVITTLPNRGYRLSVPVQLASAPAPFVPAVAKRPAIGWLWAWLAAGALCTSLVAVLWAGGLIWQQEAPFVPPAHSIAVLPFETPGGDAADANLADGLAEELITALGRVEQLRVTSNRSSFTFRGRSAPLGEIARRLGVGAVLEGSVQRLGARVHVTAHLTDTMTGYETWSKAYDRNGGDALTVQEDIASDVVTALKVHLLPEQGPRLVLGGTSNRAASDAFFAGVALLAKGGTTDIAHAIMLFDQAIALDPKFERAYEFRSSAAWQRATGAESFDIEGQNSLFSQAIRDGETAVALEPDAGTAHGALGFGVFMLGQDMRRAGNELAVAVRLAPGNAVLRAEAALVSLSLGQLQRAVDDARRSVELDPLSPDALRGAAEVYARAHLADANRGVMQQLHDMPGADIARWRREQCISQLLLGEFAQAAAFCPGVKGWVRPFSLAIAHWKLGHVAEARAAMAELQGMVKDSGAYQYAEVYAVWGDRPASAHWLNVATQEKDGGLADLLVDDFLAPMRGTAEFASAARSIGLR
jgi:TolB-like protein/DNA-binding winged helix-turn-helix (wHTH) protein